MKIYSIFVSAILIIALMLAGLIYGFEHMHRMKMVAEIPGADGSPGVYQLWYGQHGNLELRSASRNPTNPPLLYYDYYGSIEVESAMWTDHDNLVIAMKDGTKVKFKIGSIEVVPGAGESPARAK